jgi:hypothetical protein
MRAGINIDISFEILNIRTFLNVTSLLDLLFGEIYYPAPLFDTPQ